MRGLRAAASVLTRVPVGASWAPGDVAVSIPWFPVVGGLVGLATGGVYAAALTVLPSLAAAAVATCVGVALTGAFHEDGLADTADAMGAWKKKEARRILKDPSHGTYGVLAIALSVVSRIAALSALGAWAGLVVLVAAGAIGRAVAVGLLRVFPVAEEGLGAAYAVAATRGSVIASLAVGLAIGAVAIGAWALPALALACGGAVAVGWAASRKIGGITGDALGAAEQAGEILILLLGAAVVSNGWPALIWWR